MAIHNFEEIRKKHANPYELVILLSKRARQITTGSRPRVDVSAQKPVSVAIEEFLDDKLKFARKKSAS